MRRLASILLVLLTICCLAADKAKPGETIITSKGDVIIMTAPVMRGVNVSNSQICKIIEYGKPIPLQLNGKEIYYYKDHPDDDLYSFKEKDTWMSEYLVLNKTLEDVFHTEINNLPKGVYYDLKIENIVINETGRIVYYETNGLVAHRHTGQFGQRYGLVDIPDEINNRLKQKITSALNHIQYTPLIINNNATPLLSYHHFSVEK